MRRLGGDFEKAIEDFTKAIQMRPENYVFYKSRMKAYQKNGDEEKAQADKRKVKALVAKK